MYIWLKPVGTLEVLYLSTLLSKKSDDEWLRCSQTHSMRKQITSPLRCWDCTSKNKNKSCCRSLINRQTHFFASNDLSQKKEQQSKSQRVGNRDIIRRDLWQLIEKEIPPLNQLTYFSEYYPFQNQAQRQTIHFFASSSVRFHVAKKSSTRKYPHPSQTFRILCPVLSFHWNR